MSDSENKVKIDFREIFKLLFGKRKFIIIMVSLFCVLGVVYSLLAESRYQAYAIFIPQTNGEPGIGGGLSSIASLAGFDLGGELVQGEIPPSLYPKVANSIPFLLSMLDAEITVNGEKITYRKYYTDVYKPNLASKVMRYTLGLPGTIKKALRDMAAKENTNAGVIDGEDPQFISLSKDEQDLVEKVMSQMSVGLSAEEGTVTIAFEMPSAFNAAEMTSFVEKRLQEYLIDFKVGKAREQLDFTVKSYNEKKQEFEAIQEKLARFKDQNVNLNTSIARNNLERLETEFSLVFNTYTELAKQLEQAKLRVKKDTPIFSVIEPVMVPNKRAYPKRAIMVVTSMFLGGLLAVVIIAARHFWVQLKPVLQSLKD